MQDVARGTRKVKLSTGRKTNIPNAVRTVHKAEAIRLYISACEMEGYTQENGHPSERTLWNILNNCLASQRKKFGRPRQCCNRWFRQFRQADQDMQNFRI